MAASVLAPNSELWKPPTTTPQPTLPPDPTDADMSACMLAGQAVASHPLDPDPTKAWSSVAVIASDLSPSHECRSGTVILQLSAGKALEQGLQHLADTLDKMLQLPATAGPLSQAWPPATSWPDVPSSPSAYGDPCEEDPTGLAAPSPLLPQPHPSPQSSSTSGEGGLTGRWSLFSSSGGSGGGGGGGSAFSVDVDASRLAVEIPQAPAEAVSTPPLRTTPRRSPAFATLPRLDSGVEYVPGPEEALGPSPGLSPSRLGFRQFDERGSATQEADPLTPSSDPASPGPSTALEPVSYAALPYSDRVLFEASMEDLLAHNLVDWTPEQLAEATEQRRRRGRSVSACGAPPGSSVNGGLCGGPGGGPLGVLRLDGRLGGGLGGGLAGGLGGGLGQGSERGAPLELGLALQRLAERDDEVARLRAQVEQLSHQLQLGGSPCGHLQLATATAAGGGGGGGSAHGQGVGVPPAASQGRAGSSGMPFVNLYGGLRLGVGVGTGAGVAMGGAGPRAARGSCSGAAGYLAGTQSSVRRARASEPGYCSTGIFGRTTGGGGSMAGLGNGTGTGPRSLAFRSPRSPGRALVVAAPSRGGAGAGDGEQGASPCRVLAAAKGPWKY